MQNLIIKGTGNSRFLKSSIPEDITFAELVALLRAGTFPIDLNGLNEEGIEQHGTPINMSTLLQNAIAGKLGFPENDYPNVTVNDALDVLSLSAQLKEGMANGDKTEVNIFSRSLDLDVRLTYMKVGKYTGTGTGGNNNPTIINFGGDIDVKFMLVTSAQNNAYRLIAVKGEPVANVAYHSTSSWTAELEVTWLSDSLQLLLNTPASSHAAAAQLNSVNTTYTYVLIGRKLI